MILLGILIFWVGYILGEMDGEVCDFGPVAIIMAVVSIITIFFYALKGAGVFYLTY